MKLASRVRLAVALLLAASSIAHAALEDRLDDRAPDVHVEQIGGLSLRVRTRGSVKEFASPSGKIFAVRWSGFPYLPSLFGKHFAEFRSATHAQRFHSGHVVRVITPTLNASLIVYGRFARGTAVLPKSVPAGVSVDALR
jgi:hypothetical protein